MQLRLIRLVIATLGTKLTEWSDSAHVDSEITVKPYGAPLRDGDEGRTIVLLEASKILDVLPFDGDVIHVPPDIRRAMETVLEAHIDVLAVINQCQRSIASPSPYIAIEPLDEEAKSWLIGKRIHVDTKGMPIRMWHQFNFADSFPHLRDRLDGVALVAEALGHSHPTGQLHEFIRFFERAFALAAGQVCRGQLPRFLEGNKMGYTSTEVEHWLHLRDTTAHADRRPNFALQADTRPVVDRIEQAAYDVLFNKAAWRSNSESRRSVFRPFCGSTGNNGDMFVTQGKPAKLNVSIVDGFHAYPLHLKACINSIPGTWLTRTTASDSKPSAGVAGAE